MATSTFVWRLRLCVLVIGAGQLFIADGKKDHPSGRRAASPIITVNCPPPRDADMLQALAFGLDRFPAKTTKPCVIVSKSKRAAPGRS